jgi:hypothetical protein
LPGSRNYAVRQFRGLAILVPGRRFQPIADELLVERRRVLAGGILIDRPEARAVRRQDLVDQDEIAAGQLTPFEFRIGDDDAARPSILGGLALNVDGELAKLVGKGGSCDFPHLLD